MSITPKPLQVSCCRCGTCCRKGGPGLHREDQELVRDGKIPLKDLFTIRKGEPAYDNIADRLAPADADIIKIKSAESSGSACIYFCSDNNSCRIYEHRPWQCRTLTCWDPADLMKGYRHRRLARHDLLGSVRGLWDLISDHQKQCDYLEIAELAAVLHRNKEDAGRQNRLMAIIRYDHFIRKEIAERSGLAPEILGFLLGRPLTETIAMFRLKLIRTGSATTLIPFV